MDLVPALVHVLTEQPGQTARQLAAVLRTQGFPTVDKSTINKLLYSSAGTFHSDHGNVPQWYVSRSSAPSVLSASVLQMIAPRTLYAWQQEALQVWQQHNYHGVVEAVTGTGKTMIGVVAALEELHRGGKVLVLVPTVELQRQWFHILEEFAPHVCIHKLGGGSYSNFDACDVLVAVINSARIYDIPPPNGYGLLVADECHRYGSDCNKDALDERFPRRLGLSATYRRSDNGHTDWLDPYFGGTIYEMGYERAIHDDIVAHFSVALIAVQFSEEDRSEYDIQSEKVNYLKNKLVRKFDVTPEPFGEFIKEVQAKAEGGEGDATMAARLFLSAFAKRRELLAETPAKQAGLYKLGDALRNANRAIIFTQTIAAADRAVSIVHELKLTAEAIHSQMKREERRDTLDRFADGALQVIVAPQVLDEGIDVPEVDLAVIIAASKTRRQMVQRMGRVLRRKKDDRLARFALLYVEDTSEDPEHGAHGEFLDEITEIADNVAQFDAHASAQEICDFLCPM